MASKKQAALDLAAQGFKVFPIKPGAKSPPLVNDWPTKATSDAAEVEGMWLVAPEKANVGVHCAGMIVLDVDTKKGGDASLEYLRMMEDLPSTLVTRTPSGGRHLFYRLPEGHPGVPNSVEALGKGIDVRSNNGYVVAAGSETEAGSYTFEDGKIGIADAPTWLVDRLGRAAVKAAPVVAVSDAPAEVFSAAREWLQAQVPAVEGQGGDARTYAVACGLRDRGVSAAQALELLLTSWNERCSPPWAPDELGVRVDNAYRYATGEPGSKAASPDEFPVVLETGEERPKKGRAEVLSLSDFANRESKTAGPVIKGLLQLASYAETYGAPGEGKTFVALDQAYHVAAGKDWMGHKVHAGPVLYLAYEGTGGMVKRAKALIQKYGTGDVPLFIVGADFNLREKMGRQALGEVIAQLPAKPVLIVVDTFARALMGGDENSAQDVGSFNTAVAGLIASTGACVMIIHHSGKDKSKGARGSSALLGALDTEIEVDAGQVIARKQRDMEIAEPIGFRLVPMVVGVDSDGDDSTSCTVDAATVTSVKGLPRLAGSYKSGFEVLCDLRPDNTPITAAEWKEACKEFLGEKNVAQKFFNLKQGLKLKGYIVVDDEGMITRRMT